jgi:hypothetical protein
VKAVRGQKSEVKSGEEHRSFRRTVMKVLWTHRNTVQDGVSFGPENTVLDGVSI